MAQSTYLVAETADGVRAARHQVRETLANWGIETEAAATVELLGSELITNAVKHTAGEWGRRKISVRLRLTPGEVHLDVTDPDPTPPCVRALPAGTDPPHVDGRGLHLVAALAAEWGTWPRVAGKSVWFTVPC